MLAWIAVASRWCLFSASDSVATRRSLSKMPFNLSFLPSVTESSSQLTSYSATGASNPTKSKSPSSRTSDMAKTAPMTASNSHRPSRPPPGRAPRHRLLETWAGAPPSKVCRQRCPWSISRRPGNPAWAACGMGSTAGASSPG